MSYFITKTFSFLYTMKTFFDRNNLTRWIITPFEISCLGILGNIQFSFMPPSALVRALWVKLFNLALGEAVSFKRATFPDVFWVPQLNQAYLT